MMKFAGMRGGLRSVPGIIVYLVLCLTAQAAVLEDLRFGPAENRTRLVIQIDQIPRYVIDFDDSSLYVTFDSLDVPEGELDAFKQDVTEMLADYTCVLRDGKTYLKLDIAQPFYVRYFELAEPDRLVIDLYPQKPKIAADSTTTQEETAEAVVSQIEADPPAQPQQQPPPQPEGLPLTLLSSLNWLYIALPIAIVLLVVIGILALRRAKKREEVQVPESLKKEKDLAAEEKASELEVGKITAELEDKAEAKKPPKAPKKVKTVDSEIDDIGRNIAELSDKKTEPLTAAEPEVAPTEKPVEEPKQKEKTTEAPEIKRLEAADFGLELPPHQPEIIPEDIIEEETAPSPEQSKIEEPPEVEESHEPDEKVLEDAQKPDAVEAAPEVPDVELELPPDLDEIIPGKLDAVDRDLPPDIAEPERKKPTEEDLRKLPGLTDPHEELAEELGKTDELIAKLTEKADFDLELPPDIEEGKPPKEAKEAEKATPPDLQPPAPQAPEVEEAAETAQPVEPPDKIVDKAVQPEEPETEVPEIPEAEVPPIAEDIEPEEISVTEKKDVSPEVTESPVDEPEATVTPDAPQPVEPAEVDAFGIEAVETPEAPVEPPPPKKLEPEEATEKPAPEKSIEKPVEETAIPEEPETKLPETPVVTSEIPSIAKDAEPEKAPAEEEKPTPSDLTPPPTAEPEVIETPVATQPTKPAEEPAEEPEEVDAFGLEAVETPEISAEPSLPEKLEPEEKPTTPPPAQPPETIPEEPESEEIAEAKPPEPPDAAAEQLPETIEAPPQKAPEDVVAEKAEEAEPEESKESPVEAVEEKDVFDATLTYVPIEKLEPPVSPDETEAEKVVAADETTIPSAPAEKLEAEELAEPVESLEQLEKLPEAPQEPDRVEAEETEAPRAETPPPEIPEELEPEEELEESVQVAEATSTAKEPVTEIRQVVDEGEAVMRFEEGIIQWPVHILEGNRTGRIMVVDDEPEIVRTLKEFLSREDYDVLGLTDSISALESYGDWHPDLIIADVIMPEMSGVDLVQKIREEDGVNKVIFMSGRTDRDTVTQVFDQELEDGRYEFFRKPLSLVQIGSRIRDYFSSARELLSLHFDDSNRFNATIGNLAPLQLVSLQRFLWDRVFEVSSNLLGKNLEPYFVTDRLEPPADYMRRVGCQEREDYCIADVCFRSNPQCAAEKLRGEIEVMRQILTEFRQEYLQSDSRVYPAAETVGEPSDGADQNIATSGPPPRRTLHRPDGERNR